MTVHRGGATSPGFLGDDVRMVCGEAVAQPGREPGPVHHHGRLCPARGGRGGAPAGPPVGQRMRAEVELGRLGDAPQGPEQGLGGRAEQERAPALVRAGPQPDPVSPCGEEPGAGELGQPRTGDLDVGAAHRGLKAAISASVSA
ncbi:hypothetical protein [Streptomyces virginiae]|uniref:hypothetical protein n=1 Tax=Streptomyces virginiae TaxID=1961 RepID=UPI0036E61546